MVLSTCFSAAMITAGCRTGSCLSQCDLTFQWRSVLHRWPSCLLLLKAHRFGCEGRSNVQTEHAVRAGKETAANAGSCFISCFEIKWKQSLLHYWPYLLFSMKSCSSSDPLLPLTGCQEELQSCVDVCTDVEELSSAYVLTGFAYWEGKLQLISCSHLY